MKVIITQEEAVEKGIWPEVMNMFGVDDEDEVWLSRGIYFERRAGAQAQTDSLTCAINGFHGKERGREKVKRIATIYAVNLNDWREGAKRGYAAAARFFA